MIKEINNIQNAQHTVYSKPSNLVYLNLSISLQKKTPVPANWACARVKRSTGWA